MESVVEKFITDLEKLKKKQEEEKRKRDEAKRIKREERRDAIIALEIKKEIERLLIPCRMCGNIFKREHSPQIYCGSAKQKIGCSYKNMRILQKKHKKEYKARKREMKREMKKLRLANLINNSM